MKLEQDSMKPIYVQISEGIEDDILNDVLKEEEQTYSQYQIAKQFNVNPATAARGINLLVAEGILYNKRGLSMHVSLGAKEAIQKKRKNILFSSLIRELMLEARKLGIGKDEIKNIIDGFREEEQE